MKASTPREFRAVTVDAHGVLLLPDPVAIRNVLSAFNCQPDDMTCANAHYRMVRLLDLTHDPDWAMMNRSYAEALGVSSSDQDGAGAILASKVYLGTAWVPAPGAADALAQLVASGYGVAVVSNTEHGEIADVLARTNVCSVNGEGTNIAAVIDSNVIGVAKPDPRPFELAFAALNESASTCIHIGDSLHSDVVGARGVGMEVVHVDPIALCADSDHRHAASFAAFVSELLAEVTGDQIVNQEEPRSYSDGVVTIRRLQTSDLEMDLEAKDDEQITWLWEPGQRENWEAMTGDQQRAHAIRHLQSVHDGFGEGSKWCFAVDTLDVKYVAYIDFDLANNHVPLGEANIAYSSHPSYRGRGYVSRAVRLIFQFLEENTNAERAHILVDVRNVASHRVAMSVGGVAVGDLPNDHGGIMTRYIVELKNNKS